MKIKLMEIKRTGSRLQVSLPTPVKIWAGRVAAAALAAIVDGLQHGRLPHTQGDVGALISGAVVAATPVLRASGLLRPASAGQPSVAQKAVAAVVGVVTAPAAQRKQKALKAVNQAKADAEQAGRVAAQAEFAKLKKELTSKFQMTEAGLVPIEDTSSSPDKALSDTSDLPGSGIPNVAGIGQEVSVPQEDAPAVAAF